MYSKLGFFHFGKPCGNAIEALEAELKKEDTDEVAGSLIVLPEYFNVDGDYCPLAGFPAQLQGTCKRLRVTFVVPLIAEEASYSSRYNSAYLIDQHCVALICHKHMSDNLPNRRDNWKAYQALQEGCDHENPTWHNDTWIGALICMDAGNGADERCRRLIEKLRLRSVSVFDRIMCVPAKPSEDWAKAESLAQVWASHCLVFASSDPRYDSFISINGETARSNAKRLSNLVGEAVGVTQPSTFVPPTPARHRPPVRYTRQARHRPGSARYPPTQSRGR